MQRVVVCALFIALLCVKRWSMFWAFLGYPLLPTCFLDETHARRISMSVCVRSDSLSSVTVDEDTQLLQLWENGKGLIVVWGNVRFTSESCYSYSCKPVSIITVDIWPLLNVKRRLWIKCSDHLFYALKNLNKSSIWNIRYSSTIALKDFEIRLVPSAASVRLFGNFYQAIFFCKFSLHP